MLATQRVEQREVSAPGVPAIARRALLAGGLALAAGPAWAAPLTYRGFSFDTSALPGGLPPEVEASLTAQVDIVADLKVRPEVLAFFRGVPLEAAPTSRGGAGDYSFGYGRALLAARVDPPENPVLLHELIHAWDAQKLSPDDRRTLQAFYDAARRSGAWPDPSYMLKNVHEFFAMTASVALWGRAARPPFTRENLKAKAPSLYDWIVGLFGLEGR